MSHSQEGQKKLAKGYIFMVLFAGLSTGSPSESASGKMEEPHMPQQKQETSALVTKATTSLQFFKEGRLYFDAIPGSITIFLNFEDLNERLIVAMDTARETGGPKKNISDLLPEYEASKTLLRSLINFFSVKNDHVPLHDSPLFSRSWRDDPLDLDVRSPSVLKDHLIHLQDVPSVTKGGTRSEMPQPRLLGAVVSGAIGLINTVKEKATRKISEGNRKAIKHVSEVVDGLREYAVAHNEHIDNILAKIAVQETLRKEANLKDYWSRTKHLIHEVARVAHAVLNRRLSPSILSFLNVQNIFNGFKLKVAQDSWTVPFNHALHLFEMDTTFTGTSQGVTITIHIPLKQEDATEWTILRFINKPILHGFNLVEILPLAQVIAVEPITKAHIDITHNILKSCELVQDTYYCPGEARVVSTSATSCISAIWLSNFNEIEDYCFLRLRSARPMAWALSQMTFITIFPNRTIGYVKCPHEVASNVKLLGYQQVTLHPGCSLVTSEFTLYAGNETIHERLAVNVSTEDTYAIMEELFAPYDANFSTLHVPRPMGASTLVLETNRILEEATHSYFTTPALAVSFSVGMVALLALMGFIIFLYFKAKLAGRSAWHLCNLWMTHWRHSHRSRQPQEPVPHHQDTRGVPIPQVDGGDVTPASSDSESEQYFNPEDSSNLLQRRVPVVQDPLSHPIRVAFIEGLRAEVDVDSMAPATVMSRDFFNQLPAYFRRMRVPDHMHDLPFYVPFTARVWIFHAGEMHWILAAVSDDLFFADAILGRDWHSLTQSTSSSSSSSGSSDGTLIGDLPMSQITSDSDVEEEDLIDLSDHEPVDPTWQESRHPKREHSSSDEEQGWTRVTRRVKWQRTWKSHWASF